MNEEQKNIETCLPESILAEVASVPQDPQFVSLVNESLDPLKQQAVQQAGSDAYNEVVASHQPYTFTSQVAQMKSNLILLLRRFWRFPFGTGTIRSLSDMWAHYITRLQGSETYGIPSRLDQLTDLPSAPLLVADRKISGVPEAEDGMSMARILADGSLSNITTLTDNNRGWIANKNMAVRNILNLLPNCTELHLGCKSVTTQLQDGNITRVATIVFDDCEEIYDGRIIGSGSNSTNEGCPYMVVHVYGLNTTNQTGTNYAPFYSGEIYLHDYEYGAFRVGGHASYSNTWTTYIYCGCKGEKTDLIRLWHYYSQTKVEDVEIRNGACQNLTLQNLDGLTAENMYNHILLRLKQDEPNCGSGVTITLGTTNIEKLEAVEEYNTKLTELEDTYGYTFA